jgi:transposase
MTSEPQRKTERPWEPQRYRQAAQSPDAQLPEGDVVFCWRDRVPKLDVRRFYTPYEDATRGAPPFDPAMMVCLWLSASCVGVFSRRKMAQACERNVAFVAMVGANRPDFRTISAFRTLPLEACRDGLGQVLRVAGAAGLVQWGNGATDGTNMQGHAARHKAMSYGSRRKEADRLREAREARVTQAPQHDAEDEAAWGSRRGAARPAALARREDRLATIAAARRRLEARAKAAAAAERPRRAEVEADRQRLGPPRRGKAPQPVDEPPDDQAQTHCTEPELQSMRPTNPGWESGGHAQASVEAAHQISVACAVSAASNDTHQAAPMAPLTVASLEPAGSVPPKETTGAAQKMPAP